MKTDVTRRMLITLALIGAMFAAIPVGAATEKPKVVSPTESIAGLTYGDWTAAWWQWVLTFTNAESPLFSATCAAQPDGPVFFLAGAGTTELVTRDCVVPAGKTLVFPIINAECSTVEPDPYYGKDEAALRTCVSKFTDAVSVASLKLVIDGEKVPITKKYRAQSPVFSFSALPSDNFLGVSAGTSGLSVSDGYWIIIEPLPAGSHTMHFEGAIPPSVWSQNITYNLQVQ